MTRLRPTRRCDGTPGWALTAGWGMLPVGCVWDVAIGHGPYPMGCNYVGKRCCVAVTPLAHSQRCAYCPPTCASQSKLAQVLFCKEMRRRLGPESPIQVRSSRKLDQVLSPLPGGGQSLADKGSRGRGTGSAVTQPCVLLHGMESGIHPW